MKMKTKLKSQSNMQRETLILLMIDFNRLDCMILKIYLNN